MRKGKKSLCLHVFGKFNQSGNLQNWMDIANLNQRQSDAMTLPRRGNPVSLPGEEPRGRGAQPRLGLG